MLWGKQSMPSAPGGPDQRCRADGIRWTDFRHPGRIQARSGGRRRNQCNLNRQRNRQERFREACLRRAPWVKTHSHMKNARNGRSAGPKLVILQVFFNTFRAVAGGDRLFMMNPRSRLLQGPTILPGVLAEYTIVKVKSIIVGISGASGAIYAQRLLLYLENNPDV